MAAPWNRGDDTSDSDENPDILDPSSPKFDPRRALYAKSVKIPVSDAKQFNNLAEFENFLQGKDAVSFKLKKEKQPKAVMPGIIAERAAAQAREAVRKAAILEKNAGPSKRSATQERRTRSTTVFTRMEKYEKGPMSILRRCVNERLKVVVVIRAAVAVRSHCRGYIVAFDKHMNMALMDVDEKFIRPVVKETRASSTHTSKMDKILTSQTEQLTVDSDTESHKMKTKHSKSGASSSCEEEQQKLNSRQNPDLREKIEKNTEKKEKQFEVKGQRVYMSDSDVRTKDWKSHKTDRKIKSDIDEKSTRQNSDSEMSKRRTTNKKSQKKRQFRPFWPLYKKWAEERCYCPYEIVDRHVNQLFVRGDNIVSVAIAH